MSSKKGVIEGVGLNEQRSMALELHHMKSVI